MNKLARWVLYGLGGLLGLVLLAAAGVRGMSAYALTRTQEARPERIDMSRADAARGLHIAQTHACVECHGEGLRGTKFFDEAGVGTLYAPNLTLVAAQASDEQLARAIRQGIGHDGRPLFIMPSATYAAFTDGEVSDLVAFIRAQPKGGAGQPGMALGPLGHLGVATGKFQTQPMLLRRYRANPAPDLGPEFAAGRHLAMTMCADCHDSALTGTEVKPGVVSPDLDVVGAYDAAQFATLMKTGLPPGGRELVMMTGSSRASFSHFTDREVADLFAYLKARAARRQEQGGAPAVRGS